MSDFLPALPSIDGRLRAQTRAERWAAAGFALSEARRCFSPIRIVSVREGSWFGLQALRRLPLARGNGLREAAAESSMNPLSPS